MSQDIHDLPYRLRVQSPRLERNGQKTAQTSAWPPEAGQPRKT